MSRSQIARVETERWVTANGYCLACESDRLLPTPPNTPARDFECGSCGHPYELKATSKPFGARIVDGAYSTMMRRIEDGSAASFLLMQYQADWQVTDLLAVHRSLITAEVIQCRPPLSVAARRAGWVGCNILLGQIPPEGRIPVIQSGVSQDRSVARAEFGKVEQLHSLSAGARGWTAALLMRLHRFGRVEFDLEQVYGLEGEMSALFPKNQHVREKMRQQLQVLRDVGMLVFEGRGRYRLTRQ